jgi:hypothetical protein
MQKVTERSPGAGYAALQLDGGRLYTHIREKLFIKGVDACSKNVGEYI